MVQINFDPQSPAYQVYDQLIKDFGFTDEVIDRGYQTHQEIFGAQDGFLESAEVYGAALDAYMASPKNGALKNMLEGFTGFPIPWELSGDPTVEAKIQKAISQIDSVLKERGVAQASAEYQEEMAVGLFYFCLFPDDPNFIRGHHDELLELTHELPETSLVDFQTLLFENGGLGVFLFDGDAPVEVSALVACKIKKGACTEQSNILYGVYQMAGLNPFFVTTRSTDMEEYLRQKGISIPPQVRENGHEYVGVSFGGKTRFFDLNQVDSDADYPVYERVNLLQHLSALENNRGYDLLGSKGDSPNGDLDAVIDHENLAIEFDPTNNCAYNNLGVAFLRQGKLGKAEEALRTAIELNNSDVSAHYNLGIVLEEEGREEEAAPLYDQAAILDPNNATAHYYRGNFLYRTEKHDEAVEAFRNAVRLDPQYIDAYYALAYALNKDKRNEECIVLLSEGIQSDNSAIRMAFVRLSYTLALENNLLAALALVERIIEVDSDNGQAYLVASYVFFKQDKPAAGSQTLEKFIRLDLDHREKIRELVLTTATQGDLTTAINMIRAETRLDRFNADAPYWLGVSLLQQGRNMRAKSAFRKSLKRDPSHLLARQELDKLRK